MKLWKKKTEVEKYLESCRELVQLFARKQQMAFTGWVDNIEGDLAEFDFEYYFRIQDIVYDLLNDCPPGLIVQWQDETDSIDEEWTYEYYHHQHSDWEKIWIGFSKN